ncbi:hypothetical protein OpiT1DRAFT_04077 [Opitutaceae bacterium TAV1]|nr:hypothetical protein OpiT1DRAFT_04077 [Opitutaceae bacterium TAV1]
MTGTPLGVLTLRVLKAERLGGDSLLDDRVWDEALMQRVATDALARIINYIFGVSGFDIVTIENKVASIQTEPVKRTTMTVAEQYIQRGIEQGIERGIERGREEGVRRGIERGVLIGSIRTLQRVLGKPESAVNELEKLPPDRLQALHDQLARELR